MRRLLAAILGIVCVAGCAQPKRGVLVMAHGGSEEWNQAVEQVVAPLRGLYPTEIAYGMAVPSTLETAAARLEAQGVREIAVVRMFISGESFLPETKYILGMGPMPSGGHFAAATAAHDDHAAAHACPHAAAAEAQLADTSADAGAAAATVTLTADAPSDDHDHQGHHMEPLRQIAVGAKLRLSSAGVSESELIDEILVERVQGLSTDAQRESVLILAHGPGDDGENTRWLANMERRVERIRRAAPYRAVHCETLREDWPDKRVEAERRIREFVEAGGRDGGRVIVVPFRVAGFGPYAEVLAGLDYVADGRGFCPHSNMTRWIEQTAEACFGGRVTQ